MHRSLRPATARAALVVAFLLVLPTTAWAGNFAGNTNFFLGTKTLDKDDWEPLEEQGAFGAELSWGNTDWPIYVASDLFWSADAQGFTFTETIAVTTELNVGVRKIWGESRKTRPFVGGGLAIVRGYVQKRFDFVPDVDGSDAAVGPWLTGGVFWRLGTRFNIGMSARWSKADVEIFDESLDAGGFQFGLLLGFGWPKHGG